MQVLSLLYVAILLRFQYMAAWLYARRTSYQPGQGLVEYGLILVLVMVVCVAVVGTVGQTLHTVWYDKLINQSFWHP